MFLNQSPDTCVDLFAFTFMSIIESNIPNKTITVDDRDSPWITPQLKNLIKKQENIFRVEKRWEKATDWKRVKDHQQRTQEAISEAKSTYLENLGKKLCDPTSGQKTFWTAYRRLANKKKNTNIPPILEDGKYITNFKDKADLFNSYFADQCKPFEMDSSLPHFNPLTPNSIRLIDISEEKISSIINKLDSKKAHGPDGISANMLKICSAEVAEPLSIIYQKCLSTGTFPSNWKLANLQSVHKKNSRQVKTNYRPISLLCICSKIFEKIIYDELFNFFTLNKLITPNQSGFMPGDSTINQLLAITTEIYNGFENYEETRALFLDLSKAFDKVWHKGLIFKLKQNGVQGNLLDLLDNYLSDRKQRVVLNGIQSSWKQIHSGVPQGSVLGPLLFLIYINDLADGISSNIKLFADDASLFIKVKDVEQAHLTLTSDLDKITAWANQWKMKFNPEISKQAVEIIFSNKNIKPNHPPISFGGIPVARVESTTHIGLTIDQKLSFREHILGAIEKAKQGLSLMKFLSKYVNREILSLTYTMHVRPHLEYGDIIYHGCSKHLMDMLESIQYQAGLIATGCWQKTNREKLYDELGWESLSSRRINRRLFNYHKILSGESPAYLKEYVLSSSVPLTSTNRLKRSFFPYCFEEYQTLDPDFKILNKSRFKSRLNKTKGLNKKKVPRISDRQGIKYLTCLRVNHSDLREHRFSKNFNCPSPLCKCGLENETTEHFLLRCPNFNVPRGLLIQNVLKILERNDIPCPTDDEIFCKILLYGHKSLPDNANSSILANTINYINKTKRFAILEAFVGLEVPS